MNLVNDIATVRASGVKVMFFNNESSIADMDAAEERFIIPVLGKELYDILIAELDVTNSDYADLIKAAQRAVVPLAYWLDLPNIQSQISDRGAGTFSSENMQPLHKWEYERLLASLEDKGCFALEAMLTHLNEKAIFYDWTKPDKYNSIFLTGTELSDYFTLSQPHRVFESLRPVVKKVEDQYIRRSIGKEFYNTLIAKNDPDDDEKELIEILKNAVANLTIKTACEELPARITPAGFTVLLGTSTDKPNEGESSAPDNLLSILNTTTWQSGNSYLDEARILLNTKASESVFADYFTSKYYTAPLPAGTVAKNPNEGLHIFGL